MLTYQIVETAKTLPQVRTVNENYASLFMTQEVVDIFKSFNIYFGRKENRFRPDQRVHFKSDVQIEPYACFPKATWLHPMGAFSYSETDLPNTVKVGRYCSIAMGVNVFGVRHPLEWITTSSILYDVEKDGYRSFIKARYDFGCNDMEVIWPEKYRLPPPKFEHDVWVGKDATFARNITIGTGSIVAASSVVTKDVPPYAIVGGNPAQLIRYRFDEKLIDRLLKSKWWSYSPEIFSYGNYRDPLEFVEMMESQELPVKFNPKPVTAFDILEALCERLA